MIPLAPGLALPLEAVVKDRTCADCAFAKWVSPPYFTGACDAPLHVITAADYKRARRVLNREKPFVECGAWKRKTQGRRASLAGGGVR